MTEEKESKSARHRDEYRDYTDAINYRLTSSAKHRTTMARKLYIVLVIIAAALIIFNVAAYLFNL
jgi:CHASE3 domain sensor protein